VPGSEPTAAPAPSGGRFSPRNWRVATRLNAILLIPVLVGLVMGGFQVKSSIDTWQEAEDAERTARLVEAALSYGDALYNERDVSAAPLLTGADAGDKTVAEARKATDAAAEAFDRAAQDMPRTPGLLRRLEIFREQEPNLEKVRAAAYTDQLSGVQTEEGYVRVAHPLMEFANELGLGTSNLTSYGRTVYAISLTKAALSLERSIGMHLLLKPGPKASDLTTQRTAFSSYAYLEGIALDEYIAGGTEDDAQKLEDLRKQAQAEGQTLAQEAKAANPDYVPPPSGDTAMIKLVGSISSTDPSVREALAARGVTPENWWTVNTLKYKTYRTIEADMAAKAVAEAADVSADAKRDALITGAAVVVALLAAFILAGMVARQMSRSMRQLRNAAFGIAEQRLPMLVDQLSRTDPGRVDTRVAPIPITSTDEIGEVARAFDQVHREAVRLAAEQALLRGNINAIFTNLSRRNQSLIEGQLTLITELENNEADPDQLENLFKLDHLATRMRRNGENLLVLAGEEPGRRWDQPVPLIDVLRAASSEVEQYERIELQGVPDAEIHGRAVTDLVHLLAELLENATTFSSPQTKVRVTATRLPDGRIMIEIHDKGIGLTAEDFADINHKLANPPTVDAAISQRMGLFVVGRLADRHGIRVQLRPSGEQAGTTSLVMLPDAITHGGGGEQQPEDEFTVSQIIPEQKYAGEDFTTGQPMRTAAELGFDDSRYADVPDDIRELDPVGRSLMREERRAALEAQARTEQRQEDRSAAEDSADGQRAAASDDQRTGAFEGFDGRQGYDAAAQNAPSADTSGEFDQNTGEFGRETGYDGQQTGAYDTAQAGAYDPAQAGAYDGATTAYDGQQSAYDPQQTGSYDTAQTGYDQQQAAYDGQAQTTGYESGQQPAYDGQYYAADSGAEGGEGYPAAGDGYAESSTGSYAEPGQAEQSSAAAAPQNSSSPYEEGAYQGDWQQQDGYRNPYPDQYAPEAESAQAADVSESDRVGFDRPGQTTSTAHELTEAGLPRRGTGGSGRDGANGSGATNGSGSAGSLFGSRPAGQESSASGSESDADWRTANDQRWQQASALRKPKAGGVTPSGLPRRVPKANLVQGSAEATPLGGPQVSRAPEDVRGRLSNLRRGVLRGRSAGSELNGQATRNQHSGPDSTYNQER
jgi:signal transduction histidine kinase